MIKVRYKTAVTLVLLLTITVFIISPKECMNATSNGIRVWVLNVVPALFPFFIITRIIIMLNQNSIPVLDKFTSRCFHASNSGLIYFLSLLSGYPIGAKLISGYYESGAIDKQTATKMFSFCSTSGPMFIVGTVGIGVFGNAWVGYILLAGHILGSFLNGLLYRGKTTAVNQFNLNIQKTNQSDIMYDSIISILMVGGYIVFSSVIIHLLELTNILPLLSNFICKITPFNYDFIHSILCGLIEITNGLMMLGTACISNKLKIILASGLIAFSGICIMLQSLSFLNKIGIKKSTMLKQKLTQTILTLISTMILILIFYN